MRIETNPRRVGTRSDHPGFAALLALALLVLPTLALAQAGGAPKGNPRLASLNIEIWPEYDRPAALVILRAALADGVKLPATVTLRLPAASGGPGAVAYSTTADGNLLNLKHESAKTGEYITVKFVTPERFFHVEFYEPIATTDPARSFRYVWPGDMAVDRVSPSWSRSPHPPPASRWSRDSKACPRARTACATAPQTWAHSRRASRCRSRCATRRPTLVLPRKR